MNTVKEFETSFKKVFETFKELEVEKINEQTTKRSVASLQSENVRLKESNICLEKKVGELQARLDRLSDHYQSVLAERDFKNIQEKLLKSAPKLLEEENAALSDTISKMEIKLFYAEEEKRKSKENWRLHEQKMDRLVEVMSDLLGKLNGLDKRILVVNDICKRVRPAVRLLAKRSAQLQLLQSHSRCSMDQLADQLADERSESAAKGARLVSALGNVRALEAEIAGYRAAVMEQRNETALFKKQADKLRSEVECLEVKLDEYRETIRDQSDALSRLYINPAVN